MIGATSANNLWECAAGQDDSNEFAHYTTLHVVRDERLLAFPLGQMVS